MYDFTKIWTLGLILTILLISCESENNSNPEFSIQFQDGTIVNEKDILFYDSSTYIIFLKTKIFLDYGSEGYPLDADFFKFSVFVNKDNLFQGIIFPYYDYNIWPETTFISSKTFPNFESEILPFHFYGGSVPMDNPQIIESLEKSNLLRRGITCTVEDVKLSSENEFSAICTFSLKNHDENNYYVPDPEKMGVKRFHYLIGGIELSYLETSAYIYPSNGYPSNLDNLTPDDLSILESNGEATYTYLSHYNSIDTSKIIPGLYKCYMRYGNLDNYQPFTIQLNQENGRVWVGRNLRSSKIIMIE